jgi:hypothetical protein
VRGQRLAHPLGEHRPAAERDHHTGARLREQLADELLLVRAEGGLAVEFELAGDRMPEASLQQPVGVQDLTPERAGDLGCGGGLAGAHEADEDKCPPGDRGRRGPRGRTARPGR